MKTKYQQILLVALSGMLVFLPGLGTTPFWEWDEPVYASIGREMLTSGDYIVPKLNGVFYPDKPPLMYWLNAISISYFGDSEFSARLPSAVASILISILTYEIALLLFGADVAIISGLVCSTCILLVTFGRSGFLDANFTLMLMFALFSFIKSRQKAQPILWSFLTGAALGLATLSRGPLGLAMAAFTGFVYSVITANYFWLKDKRLHVLCFGCLSICLPWYLAVEIYSNGAFLNNFLISQNLMRFVSAPGIGAAPFYFYLQDLVVGCAPWSVFLISVAIYNFKNIAKRLEDREQGLLFICVLAPIFLLSLSATKWPHYMLPVIPPMAILIAKRIKQCFLKPNLLNKYELVGFALFGFFLSCSWFSLGWLYREPSLKYSLWNGSFIALSFLLITMIGGLGALYLNTKGNHKIAKLLLMSSGLVITIIHAQTVALPIQRQDPLNKVVALFGLSLNDTNRVLGVYGYRHLGLPYYLRRNYTQIMSASELIKIFQKNNKVSVLLKRSEWEGFKQRLVTLGVSEVSAYNNQIEGFELIVISK